jgi:DNA mismatch repair protein MutS
MQNFHMAVRETPEGIVFLRQVAPGGASKSYGLHVARLAGLPHEVLDEGARVLHYLESQGQQPAHAALIAVHGASPAARAPSPITQQLLDLDLCQVTPLQALTLLHQLQQQARGADVHGGTGP